MSIRLLSPFTLAASLGFMAATPALAQQQLVPGGFRIGRGFAQGLTKQAGKFHARPP